MYPLRALEYNAARISGGDGLTGRALSNLTVVEYSHGIAGALCSKAFADLGADVIKMEPPEGDPTRRFGPFPGDRPDIESSGRFIYLNANKRGVVLDLTSSHDRERLACLLGSADVFVTDLPRLHAIELGLGYEKLGLAHPGLVATYVTPFGLTGPYRDYKGPDLVTYHMGGLGYETPWFSVTDPESEYPLRAGGYQSEYLAGWSAALASIVAVFHKEAYGRGQMVDVSAMEAVADHIRANFAMFSHEISQLPESRLKNNFPWIWECRDGYVSMSFVLQHWWDGLKELMGNPDWTESEEYAGAKELVERADDAGPLVAEWFRQYTRRELFDMLQPKGVPCFPVYTVGEVMAAEHYQEREFFALQSHPVAGDLLQPGPPVRMRGTPWSLERPAPLLGQHTEEVFREYGGRPSRAVSPERNVDGPQNRPLEGIRVLDFGWILSVPHCTQWLGSMGAEILRVESNAHMEAGRTGDRASTDGITGVNRAGTWNGNNYSKLGLTLNLKEPRAIELVMELAAKCDVVSENFAPSVMDRLGLGYEAIRQANPSIIYLSGATLGAGPDYRATGWGPNTLSYGGLTSLTGYEGNAPVQAGGNLPDYAIGTIMAFHVLSAISHRRRTGRGQFIEVSMAETVSTFIPEAFMDFVMNGREGGRTGNHVAEMSPHAVYPAEGHDQWVAIAVANDDEWRAMCEATGRPEWRSDPRFATLDDRKRNERELDRLIGQWTVNHPPDHIMHLLQGAGVAAGPVMSTFDLLGDPHFIERGFVIDLDHPEVGTRAVGGLPAKFSAIPNPAWFPAPLLGQHNDYVFGELLGLDEDELNRLVAEKVVY